MSGRGHSRRLGVDCESACPQISDMSGGCQIRRDVTKADIGSSCRHCLESIPACDIFAWIGMARVLNELFHEPLYERGLEAMLVPGDCGPSAEHCSALH